MTELKTDEKELDNALTLMNRALANDGEIDNFWEYLDDNAIMPKLIHDALYAHTLEARIDKALAMRPVFPSSNFPEDLAEYKGRNNLLEIIQAILGGE